MLVVQRAVVHLQVLMLQTFLHRFGQPLAVAGHQRVKICEGLMIPRADVQQRRHQVVIEGKTTHYA